MILGRKNNNRISNNFPLLEMVFRLWKNCGKWFLRTNFFLTDFPIYRLENMVCLFFNKLCLTMPVYDISLEKELY